MIFFNKCKCNELLNIISSSISFKQKEISFFYHQNYFHNLKKYIEKKKGKINIPSDLPTLISSSLVEP